MPFNVSAVFLFPLNDRRAKLIILTVGLLCLLIFCATLLLPRSDGHIVGSDGRAYYAITRSLAFDRDFDYTNEYVYVDLTRQHPLTAQGIPQNPFAIGMPLLWLPFLLIAHLLSLALHAIGPDVPIDGFGPIYEAAVAIGTILYTTIAFLLIYQTARRRFDTTSALIASLVIWGGTAAIHYTIAEPTMSHAMTIFSVALFLYLWYPVPAQRTRPQWLALGLAGGLVALVRWQDGLILLIPLLELFWRTVKGQSPLKTTLINVLIFGTAVLLLFIPQMLMWNSIYGSPLTLPQGGSFFTWLTPHPLQVLFSTRHGLITWHPLFLIALIGLIPLWKKDRILVLVILYFFLVQLYLNSAVTEWWANDAYGGRRFTSLIPLFALPLAALIQQLKSNQTYFRLALACFAFLIIWNLLGSAQFTLQLASRRDPLTLKQLTLDRFLLPFNLLSRLLN